MNTSGRDGWVSILFEKWKFFTAIIASLLMDLVFLLLWLLALHGFNKAVDYLDPSGSHKLIQVVTIIFEFSTLALVVSFTVSDFIKIIARLRAEHRRELGPENDTRLRSKE
jgi:large-conductance mechanosensitive channel